MLGTAFGLRFASYLHCVYVCESLVLWTFLCETSLFLMVFSYLISVGVNVGVRSTRFFRFAHLPIYIYSAKPELVQDMASLPFQAMHLIYDHYRWWWNVVQEPQQFITRAAAASTRNVLVAQRLSKYFRCFSLVGPKRPERKPCASAPRHHSQLLWHNRANRTSIEPQTKVYRVDDETVTLKNDKICKRSFFRS